MNPLVKVLATIAKPFIERKVEERMDGDKPHPAQPSSQVGKVGAGFSIAMLTQVDGQEQTIACIAVLLVNLFFIYKPDKFFSKLMKKN